MDLQLAWSFEAIEDIESIATYIEKDSPYYASAVVTAILEGMALVTSHPRMGRKVPELGQDTVRERIIHSYRVIYEILPDSVLVLTVVHCRNETKLQSVVEVLNE